MLALGIFSAVGGGTISGLGEWLSIYWLKADASYATLFPALLIPMSVNMVVLPLFSLQTAARSNRLSAVFTLVSGIAAVGVAYGIGRSSGNADTFVWLYNSLFALKNLLFMPFHGGRLLGGQGGKLWAITIGTVIATIAVYFAVRAGVTFLHFE